MGGLLSELIKQANNIGLSLRPQLTSNEIVLEFTEKEFLEATTKGIDPKHKDAINIKFENGKMVIRIRLF